MTAPAEHSSGEMGGGGQQYSCASGVVEPVCASARLYARRASRTSVRVFRHSMWLSATQQDCG